MEERKDVLEQTLAQIGLDLELQVQEEEMQALEAGATEAPESQEAEHVGAIEAPVETTSTVVDRDTEEEMWAYMSTREYNSLVVRGESPDLCRFRRAIRAPPIRADMSGLLDWIKQDLPRGATREQILENLASRDWYAEGESLQFVDVMEEEPKALPTGTVDTNSEETQALSAQFVDAQFADALEEELQALPLFPDLAEVGEPMAPIILAEERNRRREPKAARGEQTGPARNDLEEGEPLAPLFHTPAPEAAGRSTPECTEEPGLGHKDQPLRELPPFAMEGLVRLIPAGAESCSSECSSPPPDSPPPANTWPTAVPTCTHKPAKPRGKSRDCPECGQSFTTSKCLATHVEVQHRWHRRITCPRCTYHISYREAKRLRTHLRQVHGEAEEGVAKLHAQACGQAVRCPPMDQARTQGQAKATRAPAAAATVASVATVTERPTPPIPESREATTKSPPRPLKSAPMGIGRGASLAPLLPPKRAPPASKVVVPASTSTRRAPPASLVVVPGGTLKLQETEADNQFLRSRLKEQEEKYKVAEEGRLRAIQELAGERRLREEAQALNDRLMDEVVRLTRDRQNLYKEKRKGQRPSRR